MKIKNPLLWLFVTGLIIRLALLFYDYSFDVNSHMGWGREVLKYGIAGFYDRKSIERYSTVYPNYPPVAIYLFTAGNLLNTLLFNICWYLNTHISAFPSSIMHYFDIYRVYAAIVKLPAVISDIGIAYYLYLIAKKLYPHSRKIPLVAAGFVLLNPAFFYNSALWGQIDSLPLVFLIAGCYYVLFRKRFILSSVLFALAILSKQSIVIFIPFIFGAIAYMYGYKKLTLSILVCVSMFWLLFLPFSPYLSLVYPFITYWNKMILVSGLPYVSNYSFNFWSVVTGWKDILDSAQIYGLSYRLWGYIISAVIVCITYIKTRNKQITPLFILTILYIVGVSVFMFFTKIHERHLLQALVFAIPIALHNRRQIAALTLISFIHFINLYHNWAVPEVAVLVTALHTTAFHMSAVIILMLASIYIAYKKVS
jgi:Gpi18-like mannosyltransferase